MSLLSNHANLVLKGMRRFTACQPSQRGNVSFQLHGALGKGKTHRGALAILTTRNATATSWM